MNKLYYLLAVFVLGGCATNQPEKIASVESNAPKKVIVANSGISTFNFSSAPNLKVKGSKTKSNRISDMVAQMATLPQPLDIGNCKTLLSALSGMQLKHEVINSNIVVVHGTYGEFEYTFNDNSCPPKSDSKSTSLLRNQK